jgi:hypothetical protein
MIQVTRGQLSFFLVSKGVFGMLGVFSFFFANARVPCFAAAKGEIAGGVLGVRDVADQAEQKT